MNLFEKLKKKKNDPCWKGYVQLGTKDKNGKEVPNCVPESTEISEVSDETLKSYTKGAMRDTISNKKDRNKGMLAAYRRLAGLKKPIMEAEAEDHGTMVFAHTDHNKNVTHLIVKKNDISTHSNSGHNPSLTKYVGHLPSTGGDKARVDSFKNVTHFAYKKSGGDPKKVLNSIKTHTLLGNQWSLEDHQKPKLKEDVEQLDELSSVTLRQYRKAVDNSAESPTRNSFKKIKSALGYSRATSKIGTNRIKSALKMEEVEHLEELTNKSLASYMRKASLNVMSDTENLISGGGKSNPDAEKINSKIQKRSDNIKKAFDKFATGTTTKEKKIADVVTMSKKNEEVEPLEEGWKKVDPKSQEKRNDDRVGKKVKIKATGEMGTIHSERKIPTFSRLVPYAHEVIVKHSDGSTKSYGPKHISVVTEEVEHLEEISQATKDSYKTKAADQVKQATPYAKGTSDVSSFAKRLIDRRARGLKLAEAKEYLHSVEVEDGPHQSTNYKVKAKNEEEAGEKAKKMHLKSNPSARGVMASGIRRIEEDTLEEAKLATPLKGHAYHKKSDAELQYIIQDAGKTARIQKGMSSENKYLDQVNDASTILHYRSKGGKRITEGAAVTPDADIAPATYVRSKGVSKDGEHSGRKIRRGAKGKITFNTQEKE